VLVPTRRRIDPADVAGIIPTRWASTRFPGKPIAPIAGRPLLEWILRGCLRSTRVKHWLVATDDRRIAAVAEACGVKTIMTPSRLKSGSDRVAFAARRLRAKWIINWQGDEWLPDGRPIDALVRALESDPECEVATLARALPASVSRNPHRVKVVLSHQKRALYFSRAPIPYTFSGNEPYRLHLGAYAFSRSMLLQFARWPQSPLEKAERLEQLRILEHDLPIAVAVCNVTTQGVDTPADARSLERMIRKGRS